jgi:hypothetical protein
MSIAAPFGLFKNSVYVIETDLQTTLKIKAMARNSNGKGIIQSQVCVWLMRWVFKAKTIVD